MCILLLLSIIPFAYYHLRYKEVSDPENITVAIQPLHFQDKQMIQCLKENIEKYYHFRVMILPDHGLPEEAYYVPRNRYKAATLIKWLLQNKPVNADYIIGITANDISAKKEDMEDFGIMGLGYRPGKSCIVSTFRIRSADQKLFRGRLAKIALHEIGHNLGLDHCTNAEDCMMHAAEASIHQIDKEKLDLCGSCKKKIHMQ